MESVQTENCVRCTKEIPCNENTGGEVQDDPLCPLCTQLKYEEYKQRILKQMNAKQEKKETKK